LEEIAKELGLLVCLKPYAGKDDLSGCIVRTDGKTIIGINSSHHPNRQRFTLAHEIGHYLLHAGERVIVDHDFRVNLRSKTSNNAFNPEEIEANIFAAELLMPAECLLKDLSNKDIDAENDEAIRELRERYHVSGQALVYRLANLGLLHTSAK